MRWFKHLSNASEDEKLAELIEIHGAEGYGIYWMILEKIADKMVKGGTSTNCKYPASKWANICGKNPRGMRKIYRTFEYLSLFIFIRYDKHMDTISETYIEHMDTKSKTNEYHIDIKCPNLLKYRDEYTKKSLPAPDTHRSKNRHTPEQETEVETEVETDTEKNIQKEVDIIISLSNELFTRDGFEINIDNFNARDMIGLRIIEDGIEKVETAVNQAKKDYFDNQKMYKNCHWELLFRSENIRKLFTQSTLSPPSGQSKSGPKNELPEELR